MLSTKKNLIVVYKDEMAMNQFRKIVESKDDTEEEIKGSIDSSVSLIPWTEKVYKDNKKPGKIQDKVLFLGNSRLIKDLIPVLDLKFDEYGVKFGWAGKQAALFIEPKEMGDKKTYDEFLKKFSSLAVPQMLKDDYDDPDEEKKGNKLLKAMNKVTDHAEDIFRDKKRMKRQMLFYGVMKLYDEWLQAFLDS